MPITHRTQDSLVSQLESPPRLGVLVSHPIQYQAPLYQELARRGTVDLEVAFLSSDGAQPYHDRDFGVTLAWNIDLLGGYRSTVLPRRRLTGKTAWLASLRRWLRSKDIVVLHGYSDPDVLLAVATCRLLGVPYLMRGDAHAEPRANDWRRIGRHLVAGAVVRAAAGALPIGQRNDAFYERYGRIPHYLAPYSVDNERFQAMSEAARPARTERLAALGLDPRHPTVIFSGKLTEHKRPLDLVRAIGRCDGSLNLLMLGDGPLREEVQDYESHLPVRCLGFVNQAELPGWYACGDVLALPSRREPWGLVVNEAMACGLVPVVSDAVGCAADLVEGIGEVFPVGDIAGLAAALIRASADPQDRRERVRGRLSRFTLAQTASGYERAALALGRPRPSRNAAELRAAGGCQRFGLDRGSGGHGNGGPVGRVVDQDLPVAEDTLPDNCAISAAALRATRTITVATRGVRAWSSGRADLDRAARARGRGAVGGSRLGAAGAAAAVAGRGVLSAGAVPVPAGRLPGGHGQADGRPGRTRPGRALAEGVG